MSDFIFLIQLVAAGLFIWGLKRMGKVKTSRQGNQYAMYAMGLAILSVLLHLSMEKPKNTEYREVVGVMGAMANVDGTVSDDEKSMIKGAVGALRSEYDESPLDDAVASVIAGTAGDQSYMLESIKRSSTATEAVEAAEGRDAVPAKPAEYNEATRKVIGQAARAVAGADGSVTEAEKGLLKSLGDALNLTLDLAPGKGEGAVPAGGLMAVGLGWILIGMLVGSGIGYVAAKRVEMTAMPQMVAIFNGFGGGASALVAFSWFYDKWDDIFKTLADFNNGDGAIIFCLSILVGVVTFSGSLVAFAKLQEIKIAGKWLSDAITLPGGKIVTLALLGGVLVLIILASFVTEGSGAIFTIMLFLALASFVLGIYLTMPIGGADMPVVISLLNSYSGIAAAMAGFVVHDYLLIVGGSMVGSAGLILTSIMCKAMNRSLWNVIKGGVGGGQAADAREYANVKSAGPEDMAIEMENATSVCIVPGYGLAVAQAQHICAEMVDLLEKKGVDVTFGIHPVAGRMPGHMNVLLAEADIDYDKLKEMEEVNSAMKNTDVCVVLGANDVINPAALEDDKTHPLYGMPIINVHEARRVFIIKRSLSPGYAGVRNPLFEAENASMVFGDGKEVLVSAVEELKSDD